MFANLNHHRKCLFKALIEIILSRRQEIAPALKVKNNIPINLSNNFLIAKDYKSFMQRSSSENSVITSLSQTTPVMAVLRLLKKSNFRDVFHTTASNTCKNERASHQILCTIRQHLTLIFMGGAAWGSPLLWWCQLAPWSRQLVPRFVPSVLSNRGWNLCQQTRAVGRNKEGKV